MPFAALPSLLRCEGLEDGPSFLRVLSCAARYLRRPLALPHPPIAFFVPSKAVAGVVFALPIFPPQTSKRWAVINLAQGGISRRQPALDEGSIWKCQKREKVSSNAMVRCGHR